MIQDQAISDPAHPRILAIEMLTSLGDRLPAGIVAMATFSELDAGLLARVRPDQILVPLLSATHDAMAVVERLEELGYAGHITVVALPLPNSKMVEQELRAIGPGRRLTLLTPPGPR